MTCKLVLTWFFLVRNFIKPMSNDWNYLKKAYVFFSRSSKVVVNVEEWNQVLKLLLLIYAVHLVLYLDL